MRKLKEEAITLFDTGDQRSFNELYEGQEHLFTDVDDLISPKFKKLFEETYQVGNIQQKQTLRECDVKYGNANGFQELDNRNDGVPEGHNRSLAPAGGSSPKVRQSTPNYSTNKPLYEMFERIYEDVSGPPGGHYDSGKGSPKPSNDGVPSEINGSALSKGPASSIVQSGARQDDNSQLGNEPAMGHGAGPKAQR